MYLPEKGDRCRLSIISVAPDVFVACHGYDGPPFPGERNKLVLSQPDGSFAVLDASPDVGFFHAVTVADWNDDSLPDVVLTESVFLLVNQGDGKFQRETQSSMPSFVAGSKSSR